MTSESDPEISGLLLHLLGSSIAGRLLRWFLILSVVPVLVVLVVTWWISSVSVESMRRESLSAIAEQKADRLHSYARERVNCVNALGVSPGINAAIRHLRGTATPEALERDRVFLSALSTAYRAPSVVLVDPAGTILSCTTERWRPGSSLAEGSLRESALGRSVRRARMYLQAEVSEPVAAEAGERPAVYATGPVMESGVLTGFMALELAPDEIDAIVLDETGLGETGVTMCAAIIGNELVVTAPTRFDPHAAFTVTAPLGSKRLVELQRAVRGVDHVGFAQDLDGHRIIGAWTHVAALGWGMSVTMLESEAIALARHQQIATMTIAALGAIPAAIVAWLVAKSLSRPVARAAAVSVRLAQGDLSEPVVPIGRGEPRRLLESMRDAMGGLAELLGRMRLSARELEQTSAEIRRTAKDQEEVAQGFGASATEVAAAVTEMTGTGRELSSTMGMVAQAAENAAGSAGRGREGLAELDARAQTLRSATDGVARRLATIRERAISINAVITTITRVSDQTNLLSINAALEAEKAGRYGLGFQVVAREINRLAEQTAEATTDIERIVAEMQESVAEGVEEMGRFSRVMEEGASTSAQIGGRLSEVITLVEDLRGRFKSVAEGVEAQSIGTRQISEALNQLSDGARRTIAAVQAFVAASAQLEQSARSLEGDVAKFTLPAGDGQPPRPA